MRKFICFLTAAVLALSLMAPALAAGPANPSQGDVGGVIASLIEQALARGEDASVYINAQDGPVHVDTIEKPDNIYELLLDVILLYEEDEEDLRTPTLLALRSFIVLNTPQERAAFLAVQQYCELNEIFEEDDLEDFDLEMFFEMVEYLDKALLTP